jgi:hypothetical protein
VMQADRKRESPMTTFRDDTFPGTTLSPCPDCHSLVRAKIVATDRRAFFLIPRLRFGDECPRSSASPSGIDSISQNRMANSKSATTTLQ